MNFTPPLLRATLVKRYKRFLADVILDDGTETTVACANTGAMSGLVQPGSTIWLSRHNSPTRKYSLSWELVDVPGIGLCGVNTGLPNALVAEAIAAGKVPALGGYAHMRREVRYGQNSRIDLLLSDDTRPDCYVEVKNTHFFRDGNLVEFPDCVTTRGAKHLDEMSAMVAQGCRAVMVYLVQCAHATRFRVAADIDPHYGRRYELARAAGVEAIALVCAVTPCTIDVVRDIPVET